MSAPEAAAIRTALIAFESVLDNRVDALTQDRDRWRERVDGGAWERLEGERDKALADLASETIRVAKLTEYLDLTIASRDALGRTVLRLTRERDEARNLQRETERLLDEANGRRRIELAEVMSAVKELLDRRADNSPVETSEARTDRERMHHIGFEIGLWQGGCYTSPLTFVSNVIAAYGGHAPAIHLPQHANRPALATLDTSTGETSDPAPEVVTYHVTRGPGPGRLEADCPCGKAPCGAVDTSRTDPACEQHPADRSRTMRNIHRADQCPVTTRRPA